MYTLQPELSDAQRTQVTNWLIALLARPNLDTDAYGGTRLNFPLRGMWVIYKDGVGYQISAGAWVESSGVIYLPQTSASIDMPKRLEVLAAFVPMTDPARQEELEKAFADAISRIILGQYTAMKQASTLVRATDPAATVQKIAFSEDRTEMVAWIGDAWRKETGEEVKIDEGAWTVCQV